MTCIELLYLPNKSLRTDERNPATHKFRYYFISLFAFPFSAHPLPTPSFIGGLPTTGWAWGRVGNNTQICELKRKEARLHPYAFCISYMRTQKKPHSCIFCYQDSPMKCQSSAMEADQWILFMQPLVHLAPLLVRNFGGTWPKGDTKVTSLQILEGDQPNYLFSYMSMMQNVNHMYCHSDGSPQKKFTKPTKRRMFSSFHH